MARMYVKETARVEYRMAADLKKEIEEAASLLGSTFTSFATEVLVERARQVKREHTQTILDKEERDAFLSLISDPKPPSEALTKLMHAKVDL